MAKALILTPRASKQLGKLPRRASESLLAKLTLYTEEGYGDTKKLVDRPGFRLRDGDYRAIFEETSDAVLVIAVAHRSDSYRG